MVSDQARVVTSNLRLGSFGMLQEIDVVNGDHLRRPPRRREQRMRRTHHVVVTGAQQLDGWPFEVVPREVQQPDGNAMIGDAHARAVSLEIGIGPVLPGAREQRERVARFSRGEVPYQLMQIFTDPGPGSQRRPIV